MSLSATSKNQGGTPPPDVDPPRQKRHIHIKLPFVKDIHIEYDPNDLPGGLRKGGFISVTDPSRERSISDTFNDAVRDVRFKQAVEDVKNQDAPGLRKGGIIDEDAHKRGSERHKDA